MGARTYETPIPGDHRWVAAVECASGVMDHHVVVYAPPDEAKIAVARRAPGTQLRSLADHGAVQFPELPTAKLNSLRGQQPKTGASRHQAPAHARPRSRAPHPSSDRRHLEPEM